MLFIQLKSLSSAQVSAFVIFALLLTAFVTPGMSQKINARSKVATPEAGPVEAPSVVPETCGGSILFDQSGGNSTSNTWGNIRTYSGANGVSVKASAFARRKSTGAWQTAFLGQWNDFGLGVNDRDEPSGDPNHKVDNAGNFDNYVLFEFNQLVDINSINLSSVTSDSDITIWIGTKSNPYSNHITLSDATIGSLGYTENNSGGSSNRTATINASNTVGNVLVVAANTSQSNDYFKIERVNLSCPSQTATLTVIKQVETFDNADESTQSFTYTATGPGMQDFALVDNNVTGPDRFSKVITTFGTGSTISVTENSAFGWTLLDLSCVSNVPQGNITWNISGTITLTPTPGSTTTCTYVNGLNVPSAASASITGRALTAASRPISNAVLTMLDVQTGETRTVRTNTFGYYKFDEVEVGRLYVVTVKHNKYVFTDNTRMFTLTEQLADLNFVQSF